MRRHFLLFAILLAPSAGWCDTVQFSVPASDIGAPIQSSGIAFYSSALDGVVLAGQSLTLDLVFSNNDLARLFLTDPAAFGVELIVDTNAGTAPGFAGTTTGYLLNPSGNQFGGIQTAGRGDGSDGSFSVGLVSFNSSNLNAANIFDISGVQFNTSLPTSGATITGIELLFSFNDPIDAVQFGTAKQLPEPSSLVLTFAGVLAILLAASWRHTKLPSLLRS